MRRLWFAIQSFWKGLGYALLGSLVVLMPYLLVLIAAVIWDFRPRAEPEPLQMDVLDEIARDAVDVAVYSGVKHRAPGTFHRDAHAKAHGCVRATLQVHDVDPAYKQGLFRAPTCHLAWVRFSNGDPYPQRDDERDARGMGIKVMGVEGTAKGTQDFLMINHPVFFVRDAHEYLEFVRKRSRGGNAAYFVSGWNPFEWHIRSGLIAMRMINKDVKSPLTNRYYSMSAYRFGQGPGGADQYAKYSAIPVPCPGSGGMPADPTFGIPDSRPAHQRERMDRWLRQADACFELAFQIRQEGDHMPIEDPTVEWDESVAPYRTVATLTIPAQSFDFRRQNRFCEDLTFSPFHTMEALAPVGSLNELRKLVYERMLAFRLEKNGRPEHAEPTDWCDSPDVDCDEEFTVPSYANPCDVEWARARAGPRAPQVSAGPSPRKDP